MTEGSPTITSTPTLPVETMAALLYGPKGSRRKLILQRDGSRQVGRIHSDDDPRLRTKWMPIDDALGIWRLTWELLEALGMEVV